MTATSQSAAMVSEYLSTFDRNLQSGERGRAMMEQKLRGYLSWRAKLAEVQGSSKKKDQPETKGVQGTTSISAALMKKDQEKVKRAANRRRVRGGAPDPSGSTRIDATSTTIVEGDTVNEITSIAEL